MPPVRALVAILATIVGVVLLVSFKTPDIPANRLGARPQAVATAPPNPPQAAGSSTSSSSSSASSTSSSSGSRYRDGHYTGGDVPNQFGDVQVMVVVSGGRISDVQALQLPSDARRSAYISQVAGPLLHDEVVQAQSADIDTISGATYTSDGYAQSVQSALDQAHA